MGKGESHTGSTTMRRVSPIVAKPATRQARDRDQKHTDDHGSSLPYHLCDLRIQQAVVLHVSHSKP